jgi:hypothetical protein
MFYFHLDITEIKDIKPEIQVHPFLSALFKISKTLISFANNMNIYALSHFFFSLSIVGANCIQKLKVFPFHNDQKSQIYLCVIDLLDFPSLSFFVMPTLNVHLLFLDMYTTLRSTYKNCFVYLSICIK